MSLISPEPRPKPPASRRLADLAAAEDALSSYRAAGAHGAMVLRLHRLYSPDLQGMPPLLPLLLAGGAGIGAGHFRAQTNLLHAEDAALGVTLAADKLLAPGGAEGVDTVVLTDPKVWSAAHLLRCLTCVLRLPPPLAPLLTPAGRLVASVFVAVVSPPLGLIGRSLERFLIPLVRLVLTSGCADAAASLLAERARWVADPFPVEDAFLGVLAQRAGLAPTNLGPNLRGRQSEGCVAGVVCEETARHALFEDPPASSPQGRALFAGRILVHRVSSFERAFAWLLLEPRRRSQGRARGGGSQQRGGEAGHVFERAQRSSRSEPK
mmetsp:Transcript_23394/g.76398  ORF Transcript_23394/g.76398 Transcript_23394/m.76398 type:complete len:323 (-) Transcript_23394:155-1123(-)